MILVAGNGGKITAASRDIADSKETGVAGWGRDSLRDQTRREDVLQESHRHWCVCADVKKLKDPHGGVYHLKAGKASGPTVRTKSSQKTERNVFFLPSICCKHSIYRRLVRAESMDITLNAL